MGADLTLVLALVAAVNALDTQTPVVRILKFDGVPRVARVRVLAHRQQIHLLATLLPSNPGHLRKTIHLKSALSLRSRTYHYTRHIFMIFRNAFLV